MTEEMRTKRPFQQLSSTTAVLQHHLCPLLSLVRTTCEHSAHCCAKFHPSGWRLHATYKPSKQGASPQPTEMSVKLALNELWAVKRRSLSFALWTAYPTLILLLSTSFPSFPSFPSFLRGNFPRVVRKFPKACPKVVHQVTQRKKFEKIWKKLGKKGKKQITTQTTQAIPPPFLLPLPAQFLLHP